LPFNKNLCRRVSLLSPQPKTSAMTVKAMVFLVILDVIKQRSELTGQR
jgi:hypothetical protein